MRDDEETPDGRGSRGPPVAAVLRFRPAQVYLGADAGGATFKLVRSGLAWGRATNDAATYWARLSRRPQACRDAGRTRALPDTTLVPLTITNQHE